MILGVNDYVSKTGGTIGILQIVDAPENLLSSFEETSKDTATGNL
jgi:hypothetical protein